MCCLYFRARAFLQCIQESNSGIHAIAVKHPLSLYADKPFSDFAGKLKVRNDCKLARRTKIIDIGRDAYRKKGDSQQIA